MPHVTLEYTANLTAFDPGAALRAINEALVASALFAEADIKSRALRLDCHRTGVAADARAFVHTRIALLPGRDDAQRAALARAVLAALTAMPAAADGLSTQFSVETAELHQPSYAKAVR